MNVYSIDTLKKIYQIGKFGMMKKDPKKPRHFCILVGCLQISITKKVAPAAAKRS